jgi:hypothetical protein
MQGISLSYVTCQDQVRFFANEENTGISYHSFCFNEELHSIQSFLLTLNFIVVLLAAVKNVQIFMRM